MTVKIVRCCKDCGTALDAAKDYRAEFCSNECRKTWGNRRMKRGLEIYDMFMCMRYRRGLAKALGIWALMCRAAQAWNEEDKKVGRVSFIDSDEELRARTGKYAATVVNT
jgi:predicted nucleic acid-binding Zn ribbon protein